MMQKDYIRNLEPKLMEHYRNLVEQEVVNNKEGHRHNIIFSDNRNHAIKYPKFEYHMETRRNNLKKEYFIGIDLMVNGVNVPQMYALAIGQEDEKPFLVMEKLDLVETKHYQKIKAIKQFNKQMRVIRDLGYQTIDTTLYHNNKQMRVIYDLGYQTIDTNLYHNCGWDGKKKRLYFYDFESWEGQRVDEIMGRNLK